jgi:hypothetical protein
MRAVLSRQRQLKVGVRWAGPRTSRGTTTAEIYRGQRHMPPIAHLHSETVRHQNGLRERRSCRSGMISAGPQPILAVRSLGRYATGLPAALDAALG